MKKFNLLLFVLILSVFCSCMTVMAQEADRTAEGSAEPVQSESFDAMKSMGLLTDDLLNADAGSSVTRAQFLGALYKLTGLEEVKTDISLPFSDVNYKTPHREAIAYFYGIGAVNGSGNGTFEPDGTVTYAQAVKIISDFLGYKPYIEQCLGEYPTGYLLMADKLNLNYGMTPPQADAPISAGAVVKLLYNAANSPMAEAIAYNEKGEAVSYSATKDRTPLTVYNNIFYDEAVLEDNGVVSLSGNASSAGNVVIGGNKYKSEDFDLTDYLGMELRFFYKSSDTAKTVLWACPTNYNEIFTVSSRDLIKDDPAYGMSKIVYYQNDRRRTVDIDDFADIVYNNALSNNAPVEYLKPQSGELRLIDNDSDGDFDIVVVKDYRNVFVNAVSSEKEFISNQYGESLELSLYNNVKIFNDKGNAIGMNEISPNRVISYLANPDSREYIYIYVNGAGKTAELESAVIDDVESYYTFKGEELKLAASLSDAIAVGAYYIPALVVGQSYTYYLDIEGNIAAVKINNESEQYAFFIAAKPNKESFASEDSHIIKMLLSDGITTVVTTGEKFRLGGYDDGIALTEKEPQVVKVTFDGDGKLKTLDFATPLDTTIYPYGFNKNEFTLDYSTNASYFRNNVFDSKYAIDGRTLVFATLLGYDGEVTYEVMGSGSIMDEKTYRSISHNGVTYAGPQLYDADEYMHANVLSITLRLGDYVNYYNHILVDEVRNFIDENGNEGVKVVGLMHGKESAFTVADKSLLPKGLKRGDIVAASIVNNVVYRIVKTYSLSDPVLAPLDTSEAAGTATGLSFVCGYLYSNDGVNINLYKPDGWNHGGTVLVSPTRNNASMNISVYDARNDRVYPGTANQLYQNCTPQADGTLNVNEYSTKIFIARRFGYINDLIAVYY